MPQKRWRIDGNFVASPGEFLLQGNPTVQRTHCALAQCSSFSPALCVVSCLVLSLCVENKIYFSSSLCGECLKRRSHFCPTDIYIADKTIQADKNSTSLLG